MRTTDSDDNGSPSGPLGCDAGALRRDTLELVLAAGRIGFCRLHSRTRLLIANSQFLADFGWPPDATIGWSDLEERIHRDDRSAFAEAIRAAVTDRTEIDLSVKVVWPNGRCQALALSGRVAGSDEPQDLLLIARNVSGHHRMVDDLAASLAREQELRTAAEAANRAKDEFLSVVSHELRSPLNAMLGWNRILAVKRADDPEVAAITPRIERSAKAQLKMVNDLLDLGRLSSGKLKIEGRPMKLATVAASVVDGSGPAAVAKGVEIVADFAATSGRVHGDPDRLRQVVSNLLSNALKFTPRGGRIAVSLERDGDFIELKVCDTGQGIAADLLPHVFERFRQGDSSSTRKSGGLGLGLTLVRDIVALHGGSVSVASAGVGRGATFGVRLPSLRDAAAGSEQCSCAQVANAVPSAVQGAASPQCALPGPLEGLSILVVDDEVDARTVVAETLRLDGANVTVSDSARAALEYLRAQGAHYDVVVTDIGMPFEDGYSLVRKLRAFSNGSHVLAIALTGYASKRDAAVAFEAGFDLHVPKPVDFDWLVATIQQLSAPRRRQSGQLVASAELGSGVADS